jgi:hypothetical protein
VYNFKFNNAPSSPSTIVVLLLFFLLLSLEIFGALVLVPISLKFFLLPAQQAEDLLVLCEITAHEVAWQ